MKIFVVVTILSVVCAAHARVYTRCELVQDLLAHSFNRADINNWVCLVEHESRGDTNAINPYNTDGSKDFGLFQINSMYWCGDGFVGKGCNLSCQSLLNDQGVEVAAACVKQIFNTNNAGFTAWMAWLANCQNGVDDALGQCGM